MTKRVYYFRPSPLEKLLRKLSAGYQSVAIDRDAPPSRWRLPAVFVVDAARDRPKDLEQTVPFGKTLRVIYLIQRSRPPRGLSKRSSFALLSKPASRPILEKALSAAFEALSEVRKRSRTRKELVQTRSELGTLNRIGLALSTEHNTDVWKRPWHLMLDRWLAGVTQRIITVSEAVRQFYMSRGLPEDRLQTIPNGIMLEGRGAPVRSVTGSPAS